MIYFKVKNIGAKMVEIVGLSYSGVESLRAKELNTYQKRSEEYNIFAAKSQKELAELGIRKYAQLLHSDVVENFQSLVDIRINEETMKDLRQLRDDERFQEFLETYKYANEVIL